MHKQISKHFLPLLEAEEIPTCFSFLCLVSYMLIFVSIYMLQLVGQPKAPFPGEEEEKPKRNGRHHLSQEELSMQTMLSPWWDSQHSQVIVVLKLLRASLQLLKSQLETQCGRTALPWGARSPPGLAG